MVHSLLVIPPEIVKPLLRSSFLALVLYTVSCYSVCSLKFHVLRSFSEQASGDSYKARSWKCHSVLCLSVRSHNLNSKDYVTGPTVYNAKET